MRCSGGHELPNDAAFCPQCGNRPESTLTCPRGHQTGAGDLFCRSCGLEVNSPEDLLTDLDKAVLGYAKKRQEKLEEGKKKKWLGEAYGQIGAGFKALATPVGPNEMVVGGAALIGAAAVAPVARMVQLGYLNARNGVPEPVEVDGEAKCLSCGETHAVVWFYGGLYATTDGHRVGLIRCRCCGGTHDPGFVTKSSRLLCGKRPDFDLDSRTLLVCGVGLLRKEI